MSTSTSSRLEKSLRVLTVGSFVLLAWVGHRSMQVRTDCVTSDFVAYVRLSSEIRVENCRFESRLAMASTYELSAEQRDWLRALERGAADVRSLFPDTTPVLTVEVSVSDPKAFVLQRSGLRLGADWLNDRAQLTRAMAMAHIKTEVPSLAANQFQLEVMADFMLLSTNLLDESDAEGRTYSLKRDALFPTATTSFADYCRSPFRSLAHTAMCALPEPASDDLEERVWGFRPLLSAALWRAYRQLPLSQKYVVLERIRSGQVRLPVLGSVRASDVQNLVDWFAQSFARYSEALGIYGEPVTVALRELDVEAPTHWELTVDLTHTPAWREVLKQLEQRSRWQARERALVFTPEGERALPSGLRVSWAASDIQSQKHVLVACGFPAPTAAIQVRARQFFAENSCERLSHTIWD